MYRYVYTNIYRRRITPLPHQRQNKQGRTDIFLAIFPAGRKLHVHGPYKTRAGGNVRFLPYYLLSYKRKLAVDAAIYFCVTRYILLQPYGWP